MYYASIGFLAALILLIENHEILLNRVVEMSPAMKIYRKFLFAVLAYYVTDVLWGILDSQHLVAWLFADTVVYFVAMALGVLLWTRCVMTYLDEETAFSQFLVRVGRSFFAAAMIVIFLNCFMPILFWFDEAGGYHACEGRYMLLLFQVMLYLLASLYTLRLMGRTKGALRKRYRTIGFFGMAMAVLISLQMKYPLLPLYSVGYMLGTSLIHTFVVNDAREEYRQELAASLEREIQQRKSVDSAWQMAYMDPLTGVKSRLAYLKTEEKRDRLLTENPYREFALAVFDLNGLKEINDRRGHEVGDQYIIQAVHLICSQFKHSPVFRVGGDEFTAILEGEDFRNRYALKQSFDQMMEAATGDDPVVAMGIADYIVDQDRFMRDVFERADQSMYQRKRELKNLGLGREDTPSQETAGTTSV